MTEEEKMLAGEIYDANYNKDLIEKRIIAKELCKKYNELHVRDIIGKKEVIEKLLQKEVKQFTLNRISFVIMVLILVLEKTFIQITT